MSNNIKQAKLEKGQSFMEVVLAIALISIVLITIVSLATVSIRASIFSRNQTEAARFSQQASEWLRLEKESDWTIFSAHAATPTWCLDSLYWANSGTCSATEIISGTPFTRQLTFTVNADSSIEGFVETKWTDAQGVHTATSSTIYTNWK